MRSSWTVKLPGSLQLMRCSASAPVATSAGIQNHQQVPLQFSRIVTLANTGYISGTTWRETSRQVCAAQATMKQRVRVCSHTFLPILDAADVVQRANVKEQAPDFPPASRQKPLNQLCCSIFAAFCTLFGATCSRVMLAHWINMAVSRAVARLAASAMLLGHALLLYNSECNQCMRDKTTRLRKRPWVG